MESSAGTARSEMATVRPTDMAAIVAPRSASRNSRSNVRTAAVTVRRKNPNDAAIARIDAYVVLVEETDGASATKLRELHRHPDDRGRTVRSLFRFTLTGDAGYGCSGSHHPKESKLVRRLSYALVAIVGVLSLVTLPSTAQAAGRADSLVGNQAAGLECTIYPYWTYPPVYSGSCVSPRPSYSSTIQFRVQSPTPGATYSWSLSGAPLPSSCTSTSSTCTVVVNTTRTDRYVTATVTSSAGDLTSDAWALAACPGPTGVEFC
ncbi:hypothetical protein [Saccharothrix stipae]